MKKPAVDLSVLWLTTKKPYRASYQLSALLKYGHKAQTNMNKKDLKMNEGGEIQQNHIYRKFQKLHLDNICFHEITNVCIFKKEQ